MIGNHEELGPIPDPAQDRDFALVMFTAGGMIDATFGGDGIVKSDLGSLEWIEAVAPAPDGGLVALGAVAAGGPTADLLLTRYEADGDLDQSFGDGGSRRVDLSVGDGVSYEYPAAVALDAGERIFVAASAAWCTASHWCHDGIVAGRFEPDGDPDPSFGGDGVGDPLVVVDSPATSAATAMAVDSAGRATLAGRTGLFQGRGSYTSAAFARYTEAGEPELTAIRLDKRDLDGAVDPAFGVGGAVTTPQLPRCRGELPAVLGTAGGDLLVGSDRRDVIVAGPGADRVRALEGRDLVCAGAGDDLVRGGSGQDLLLGQRGSDTLFGGRGRDRVLGGPGRDLSNP